VDDASHRDFRTIDDVDDTFAEAIVHRPFGHTVLGFRLRPFCFWHAANLDFIESPFAGHKKPIDFAALYVATRICQLTYPNPFRRQRFEYIRELWKARKYRPVKIARRDLKAKRIHKAKFPFLGEMNKFSTYIRDYSSRPDYVAGEDSSPIRTPWYLYEVSMLRRFNPDMSWEQAWNMPIGQAAWFNAGMLEASGMKLEILTPEMRKSFAEAEQLEKDQYNQPRMDTDETRPRDSGIRKNPC
jgi:hypothetical protein